MANRDDIKMMIGYLKLAFANYSPVLEGAPNSVDVLLDLLGDLPTDTLRAAVKACCSEIGRAFAPSPGEIREAATKLHVKASGTPDAYTAWTEVLEEVARTGSYREPGFTSPLIEKAVKCLGWQNICLSENIMAERAHFFKIYTAYYQRAVEDAAELPALSEYVQNRKRLNGAIAQLTDKLALAC
jgi:hypothetical protein